MLHFLFSYDLFEIQTKYSCLISSMNECAWLELFSFLNEISKAKLKKKKIKSLTMLRAFVVLTEVKKHTEL